MLLFQKRFLAGLQRGEITLTFRQWPSPRVRAGRRYRVHPIGVVEVDEVSRVRLASITDEEARLAGFQGLEDLQRYLAEVRGPLKPQAQLFRVRLHHAGDGDHVPGALDTTLGEEEVEAIARRLRDFDDRSASGPWTRRTLLLIQKNPRQAASKLAPRLKLETQIFKDKVVKLKKLGLTQSFEVGYELSPRGRTFLERRKRW